MFSIGFLELLMVAVVGLLVLGPDRLPGAVRETTLWINQLKRMASDVRRELDSQVEDLENDAMLLKMREGRRLLDNAQRDMSQTISPALTARVTEAAESSVD